MKLRDRYRRLTFWNKLGAWGALASVVGIPLAVALFVLQPTPRLHITHPNVFDNLKSHDASFKEDPLAARTFWLLHEPGASITLGARLDPNCFRFTLGSLRTEEGRLIQQIFLSGPGFGVRSHPRPGVMLYMANRIDVKGSDLRLSNDLKKMWVELTLEGGNFFEISTEVADISLRVLDIRSDSLRIHLEVRRGTWMPRWQRSDTRPG